MSEKNENDAATPSDVENAKTEALDKELLEKVSGGLGASIPTSGEPHSIDSLATPVCLSQS